jgi:hypothetical protein
MMKPMLAILAITCTAPAAPVRVNWTAQNPGVGIAYKVVRIDGTTSTPLGETSAASLVVDAKPGDKIAVVAFSPFFPDAPPSPPLTIPSGRIFAVTIQASTDAAAWQTVTILLPEEMTANGQAGPRLFIRQKKP